MLLQHFLRPAVDPGGLLAYRPAVRLDDVFGLGDRLQLIVEPDHAELAQPWLSLGVGGFLVVEQARRLAVDCQM